MVRGAAVLKGDGMIKLDTQSHRTTRFANHNLTWASPRSPSTAHCPPDAFAGLFKHVFWRCLAHRPRRVSWQWLTEVTRDMKSLRNGTLVREALVLG